MNLVFLGPPGAGKGTIADLAKDYFHIPHISTGDLFRANIKNETELGKQVKAILASGGVVPDDITIAMVKNRLMEKDAKAGYILDGFPRTVPQADALKAMGAWIHNSLIRVIVGEIGVFRVKCSVLRAVEAEDADPHEEDGAEDIGAF